MGIGKRLKKRALGVSQKAVERLLADEERALKVASLVGKVQRGKKALDKRQDDLLRALQFAPREDFKAVGKKLAGLKRRLRELDQKLSKIDAQKRTS